MHDEENLVYVVSALLRGAGVCGGVFALCMKDTSRYRDSRMKSLNIHYIIRMDEEEETRGLWGFHGKMVKCWNRCEGSK